MKIRSDFILPELKYKRILLKVSGEALAGDAHRGLDFTIVDELCESIKTCVDMGVHRRRKLLAGRQGRCG